MLHSKYYKKETNEDKKTSAAFENLMLLPDNVFWPIFRTSCFDAPNLPFQSGKLISYDFWPHWDRTGTDHANYVEPDSFLEFEAFNVIIEGRQALVYKCIWLSLLTSVDKYAKGLDNTALPGYDASATRR